MICNGGGFYLEILAPSFKMDGYRFKPGESEPFDQSLPGGEP